MANNIKGITVEINGDTGPLDKALKGINTTSRSLQSELKEVNKQLKLDPTNTVLLQQKQDLLAKSITNTKDKLGTLKEAEKQAEQQFAQGKIGEEQFRALQREVINTENQLKTLETQYTKVGTAASRSLVSAGNSITKVGEGVTDVGKKVSIASAVVSGLGATAVASYKSVKVGMDEVIKATGATGESAKELEVSYKNIGRNSTADFATIGQALGAVSTRFNFTGKAAEDCTQQFIKFAKINNMDAKTSVELVSRAMGDAGIKSEDYSRVLDMLTVAAQKSGIGMESLTTNLAKYGAPMRALGIDTETSIAMFAGWEKAGVNTEIAFAGMKKAISNWGSQGKDSSQEFAKTLEEIKKAPDIATATSMAIDIFGQKAGPDLADAIKGGRFEVQDYVEALKKSSGAVTNTTNEMADGTGVITKTTHAAQIAAAEFGDTIVQTVVPIITSITDKIKNVTTYLNSLSEGTRQNIVVIGLIIAILGPAIILIGTLISAIGSIVAGVGAVVGAYTVISGAIGILTGATVVATPAMTALAGAFTFITGPIGITIAIIAALVAGFIYLWNNCESFRTFWINLWNGIKELTKVVVDGLVEFFTVTIPGAFNATINFVKSNWQGLLLFIVNPFAGAFKLLYDNCDGFRNFINSLWTSIKTTTESVWNGIKNFFSTVWKGIVSAVMAIVTPFVNGITNIFNSIKPGLTAIFDGIKLYFTGIWDAIKTIFLGAILLIIDLVTGNFTKLSTDAQSIFTKLQTIFAQIWDGIRLIFTGAVTAISGFLKLEWDGIVNVATTIWNTLATFFTGLWTSITTVAQGAWEGFKNIIVSLCEGISTGVIAIWNGVTSFFQSLPGTLYTLGVNMFTNLKNGIGSILDTLGSYISTGFSSAIKFITDLPGEAVTWGKDFVQGLVDGIKSAASAVGDAVNGIAQDIRSFLHFSVPDQGPLTDYESWMPDFMEGLSKGIEKSKHLVTTAINGLSTDISVGVSPSAYNSQLVPSLNSNISTNENTHSDLILKIDKFYNNRSSDIQHIMEEAEFYRKIH